MPSPPRRATRSAAPATDPASQSSRTLKNTSSSSSSVSSVSAKAHRSAQKSKSTSPVSSSVDQIQDDAVLDAGLHSRRSQRTRKQSDADLAALGAAATEPELEHEDDETAEDAENDITRCVCGKTDYQQPEIGDSSRLADSGAEPMYIQCDLCMVWQHGGCVGIYDASQAPNQYFCEICDPEAHQIAVDPKGQVLPFASCMSLLTDCLHSQRYSRYQPKTTSTPVTTAQAPSRKTSLSAKNEHTTANRDSEYSTATGLDSVSARRRPTMNSSRTDYDEEEAFRKAIEQSKAENETKPAASRKGKRGRADSEVHLESKRQRTGSGSDDAASHNTASVNAQSDNDHASTKSHQKKARATASEAQRNKEMRDREMIKEQQRLDAANRRKDRAGRRKLEDLDAPDEPTPVGPASPGQSPPVIDVAPPASPPLVKKSHGKKPKRSGRNQYSAPLEKSNTSPTAKATGQSTSSGDDAQAVQGTAGEDTALAETTSHQKTKGKGKGKFVKPNPASNANDSDGGRDKTVEHSLQDMENATQWMLTFINKSNLAIEAQVLRNPSRGPSTEAGLVTPSTVFTEFGRLSSTDMAEKLKDQIMSWRSEFATSDQALEVTG